ncbi:MAG: hypothetical protein ACYC7E_14720 [Armatimonadota bacterium]
MSLRSIYRISLPVIIVLLCFSVVAFAADGVDMIAPDTDGGSAQVSETASAQEPVAEATEKAPFFEVHGFLQNNTSQRVVTSSQYPAELLKLENRLQLELTHTGLQGGFQSKTDVVWDPDNQTSRLDLREAYLTRTGKNLDLTVGKQIITWGVGDLVFLTDVFPKDWVAFITGSPIEYLKKGSVAAKADYYVAGTTLEGVVIPVFTPDTLPGGDKLAFFSPFPAGTEIRQEKPPATLGNAEVGLRASHMIRDYDTALYLFSGWDPRPSPNFTDSTLEYNRLGMAGMSFQGPWRGSLLSGELAYYQTEDRTGSDPAIPNPSLKSLLSLERTLKGNRVVSVQWVQEWMTKYDAYVATLPAGFPRQARSETTLTARYRDTLHGETIKRTLFVLYNPTNKDYFVNAEWRQDLSDNVWYAVGVNLFGGKHPWTNYGQFEHDSNLYFTLRRGF